ncbi:MAG TPA: NAD(P)/FAD-dependent oxidoreductase [Pseudonocardiaceae bacterium]|jgi:2-polyprenyl-6-methoxyphenol hydroxylase-like FAD-dependent oxidoreductase
MHVLIAGGGVGGLCLAQGLTTAGVGVTVFERDAAIATREQGYRIHIDANGNTALRQCLPPDLFALYLATSNKPGPAVIRVLDQTGRQLTEFAAPGGDDAHNAVDRLTLRQVLAHGLGEVLRFGARVTDFVEHEDRVEVRYADGSVVRGDVLVAADGINSLVRKRLLPGAELVDTGLRCVYGRTPLRAITLPERLRYGFTSITDRHGRAMVLAAFEPREPLAESPVEPYLMWAVLTDEDWPAEDPQALHRLALRHIDGWAPELRGFVERADVDACLPIPIRSSVPVPPWPTGRVTLLGDAIHAMTPAGGVGANTAMRDAALLTEQLVAVERGAVPLRPALAEYEARMREYGFAAVTNSLRSVEMLRPKAKTEAVR